MPTATASPAPQRLLALIRNQFRSHRPPPAFVTYTLVRKQMASNGYPDLAESYTKHIWVRNNDRAALYRYVYRDDARGPLQFDRPAFNEARDPGPPTADIFEPAPLHPHPVEFVPTPEPQYTQLPVIGGVSITLEFDYQVTNVVTEGSDLHVSVQPKRDPDRNRIREIWADKQTYELHKLVATDKLFIEGRDARVYPATDTIIMGIQQGIPIVTSVHADVGGGYNDDGKEIDITFKDITFPAALPSWYFDPHTYAQHQNDGPS